MCVRERRGGERRDRDKGSPGQRERGREREREGGIMNLFVLGGLFPL